MTQKHGQIDEYGQVEKPELVQGSGVGALKTGDGGVVTAAQLSAGATGKDSIVIGVASEAFDHAGGGAAALVGAESAVIDLDDDDDRKPHYGHNSVAKVRMDWMPKILKWLLKRRVLFNSSGYYVSAQPETAFEAALEVEPGAVAVAIIQAPGCPGVMLAQISGDMCEWHNEGGHPRLYWPIEVDGQRWGVPLKYLGPKAL